MPRISTGPRLWLDKARDKWTIIDGSRRIRTGCTRSQKVEAEEALKNHIGDKHTVVDSPNPSVAEVLDSYLREHIIPNLPPEVDPDKPTIAEYRIGSLTGWWGVKTLDEVTADNCRAYTTHREKVVAKTRGEGGTTGSRGDLEVLRAAINRWHREHGPLARVPVVTLPDKPERRDQWCTRKQIARLLWASRKAVHNLEPDPDKRPRLVRHLSRFIIFAYYTGSRSGVVLTARHALFDYENNFMKRKPHGARKTKKRAPKHAMPRRLKTWLLRWRRIDKGVTDLIVHIHGQPITKLRRSWATARRRARLPDDVTPHTLRHSRATHLKKSRKVSDSDAAEFMGMTVQTYNDTYGHHDPEWQRDAAEAR